MAAVIGIALIVMAVFLVISILLQSSKDHRLSGTIAGGAETFFGKQKGKTVDALLNKITAVVCALFFICVLAMFIVVDNGDSALDNGVVVEDGTVVEDGAEATDETVDETADEVVDETADEVNDEEVADETSDKVADEASEETEETEEKTEE